MAKVRVIITTLDATVLDDIVLSPRGQLGESKSAVEVANEVAEVLNHRFEVEED